MKFLHVVASVGQMHNVQVWLYGRLVNETLESSKVYL